VIGEVDRTGNHVVSIVRYLISLWTWRRWRRGIKNDCP